MHGAKRVLIFCLLTTFVPIFLLVMPLYLRHKLYADVIYAVTESDIMEISDGVSTMFCSAHTLSMTNSTFNAFQMGHKPEVTSYRKHIRLKKSMTLPDDTLEYWGFYLLRGATVALSVCSKSPGASILVVKGQRTLSTCGLLDHNQNKARRNGIFLSSAQNQVKITFETNAQLIETRASGGQDSPQEVLPTPSAGISSPDPTPEHVKIPSETLNRLSPSVQSYIAELISSRDSKTPNRSQNYGPQVSRRVRHVRKRFDEKIYDGGEFKGVESPEKLNRIKKISIKNEEKEDFLGHSSSPLLSRSRRSPIPTTALPAPNPLTPTQKNYFFARTSDYLRMLTSKKQKSQRTDDKIQQLKSQLESPGIDVAAEEDSKGEKIYISHKYKPSTVHRVVKRSQEPVKPPALLDRGVKHGGNAFIIPEKDESSVSSFEEGLFDCYEGNILLAAKFPQTNCHSIDDLFNGSGLHMQTHHNVTEDGYYYYIFYSDNDFVSNDIHAVFDIWKPTFQYENVTKSCVNVSECTFTLDVMSNDRVIVEMPTRDGIEHEDDDISLLLSVCHPRVGLYVFFPIAVLLFILGCAFL
ncbi:uncharacterized protein [Fopius arisanus]|uniref:MUC3B_0 protein n=1 Tax=Fopius arisanus TaxID=64838 RepID=A0A0C9R6G1_9HYME|nr:PREDICTED: uncharacterized protein LOC105268344 [Fopius arisanus]XP_011306142.1 PREDICTED: uncharacterized protein LOC105268344 [Fopius arisanus]XP_011306143.1 PREDICTED: uncharacterized protein LOC105268344 [Fopius arisanus]XP_011306144.1 PREDICTED: uncharacterized protein LOC105268344 [Fopius arisanus]